MEHLDDVPLLSFIYHLFIRMWHDFCSHAEVLTPPLQRLAGRTMESFAVRRRGLGLPSRCCIFVDHRLPTYYTLPGGMGSMMAEGRMDFRGIVGRGQGLGNM